MMSYPECVDCKGSCFTIYHGDLTCTQCGLVMQSHLCEEAPGCFSSDDLEFVNPIILLHDHNHNHNKLNKHNKFLTILEERFNFDNPFMTTVIMWFKIYTDNLHKRFCLKTLLCPFAGCIYCVSKYLQKGITIDYIRVPLGLGKSDVLSSLPSLLQSWKRQSWFKDLTKMIPLHSDQISRIIYALDFIPEKGMWDVVKTAKKLYNKINGVTHCEVSGLKCHTFNATCIYISLVISGFKITKKEFCERLCISLPTLKNQEKIVQNILHGSQAIHKKT